MTFRLVYRFGCLLLGWLRLLARPSAAKLIRLVPPRGHNGVGATEPPAIDGPSRILRRDRLGGLIHEYAQVA
ncbi:hypothetical protein ACWGCW_05895 [Streptomyces sp. NPDC054933]